MQAFDSSTFTQFWQDWSNTQQSLMTESMTQMKRMSQLPFLAHKAQRVKKGATPSEVIYSQDRLKVLHYKSDSPPKYKTPLVFVFALVNRPYILDILPNKSVVKHFVDAGFDTYLVDWGVPTPSDNRLSFESYVDGYLVDIQKAVEDATNTEQINILGYCMGGTMTSMYTALYPEKVKNLILLAAGIDFETREGLLNLWNDAENFDVDAFVDAYGNCPAHFLQSIFLMLKPVANLLEKPINFIENMGNDKFVDEYMTMETWLNDNIPVPGEIYREYVKYLYQQNRLVNDQMKIGDRTVHLKNITCPILNLMASKDDLVPASQSERFNDLVGSTDRESIRFPTGHIGLAVGSRTHKELWPKACEWLAKRCDA